MDRWLGTMSIQYTYDKGAEILIVKLTGLVNLTEMQAVMMQILEDKSIPEDTNAIWDVSGMEFNNITLEFQEQLVEMRKQIDARRGQAKIAILSNYALAEPLIKMYTILSKDLMQTTKMFMTEEEAREWLSEKAG